MKKLGGYLAFFGGFAIVLKFFDRVPRLLFWIYTWGDTVAWIIMLGFLVGGLALMFLTPSEETEEKPSNEWNSKEETESKE
ncbi:hypothetical protein [Flavobacterium sp. J27]|uniref:hypothetical protein n=1 Tax=Flavobacterium sp. J27 TaxID=2060419 RepID=UPI0010323944|nr:hypothetical protein [Flavobacterium sp. J27]